MIILSNVIQLYNEEILIFRLINEKLKDTMK